MPPMVCRLRLRAGEPLGLSIYPRPTFLSLPFEVRVEIYKLILTSSDPVTVFPFTEPRFRGFAPKFLLLNRTIAAEAATVFYECNVFKFRRDDSAFDCWDALYSFLLLIGARNRAYLRYLEADILRPVPVSVDAQGTVSSIDRSSTWIRKVHAREQHTRIYPPVLEVAYLGPSVDFISPAIEAIFRLLGPVGSRMQLSLLMAPRCLPQLFESDWGRTVGWSGEVPNFIEILRRRFTCGPDEKPRVEVLWKGSLLKLDFMARCENLKKDGWEILEVSDVLGPPQRWNASQKFGPTCYFTLRRENFDPNRSPVITSEY